MNYHDQVFFNHFKSQMSQKLSAGLITMELGVWDKLRPRELLFSKCYINILIIQLKYMGNKGVLG